MNSLGPQIDLEKRNAIMAISHLTIQSPRQRRQNVNNETVTLPLEYEKVRMDSNDPAISFMKTCFMT